MPTLVIVGAQWGDEAKGKLVDVLGAESDLVIRYSGGNNAGHTVIAGGQEFKFHLLPAGILHPNVTAILGGGMVVCPVSLLEELRRTQSQRSDLGKLLISKAAHVVFPYHRMLDRLEEAARGDNPIGTTARGIGPAYQDKVARIGIRMGEFVHPEIFRKRFSEVLQYKNRLLEMFGEKPLEFEPLHHEYSAYAEQLRHYVADTEPIIQRAVQNGSRVLFEGAQGTFLDLDSGSYPYVTSSYPSAGGACLGTGIGPLDIDAVVGVCKAYTTRVGSGPFPTELHDDVGEWIRQHGKEFGTTTGRGRQVGWQDLVILRHSARLNSLSGLVMTRLDILAGFATIKAAIGYQLDGKSLDFVPANTHELSRVEPIYREFEGWTGDLRTCRTWNDLPEAAREYIRFVEEFTGVPVVMVSVGPDREETIVLDGAAMWAPRPIGVN